MNKEQNSSEIFTCVRYPVGCPDGKIQLPHLVEKGMDIAAWEFRRAEIRRRLHAVMGLAPPVTILRWRVLDQTIQENVLCKRIAYSSCDGETATGYLLTGTCLREQRRPAILALHPTDLECADSLVARRGECEEDYPYALELARRGFVVFAPDLFMRWHYPNAAATEQLYDTEVLSALVCDGSGCLRSSTGVAFVMFARRCGCGSHRRDWTFPRRYKRNASGRSG